MMHVAEAKQHGGAAAARTAGRLGSVPDARRPCRPGNAVHTCMEWAPCRGPAFEQPVPGSA